MTLWLLQVKIKFLCTVAVGEENAEPSKFISAIWRTDQTGRKIFFPRVIEREVKAKSKSCTE